MKRKFTDLVSLVGTTPSYFSDKKRYVSTGAVDRFSINEEDVEIVTYANRPTRANLSAQKDDILFAKMAETLKTLRLDDEQADNIYSTGFCAIRANKQLITPQCLYYLVSSPAFLSQKDKNASGATQRAITNAGLANIYVSVPSLDEQKEAIKILDSISLLMEKRKKQLVEIEKLVKSQFIEMFGTAEHNYKNYPIEQLGKLCVKITDGKHGGCTLQANTGYYFVGAREVYDDEIHYESAPQIPETEFLKDYKRCDLRCDDLVIVNTGATIGKSSLVDSPLASHTLLQKSVALIRTNKDRLLPLFLKYCYAANPEMYRVRNASAQPNLLLSRIKATAIVIPPIELQNEFAHFVEQTDKSKFRIKQSLEKLEMCYKALLQKYFG